MDTMPDIPDNVAAYYSARDGLRGAMEGQRQAARAYVMPDMYTAIDYIVAGYGRIERAAATAANYAAAIERAARLLALIVNDGHTLRDVFEYETARANYYMATINN